MTDFLDTKRREIDARLQELRPLVEEFERLEKAAQALAGANGATDDRAAAAARPRRRATPARANGAATSKPKARAGARRGRPRGSGARGKQALELVKAKPGITIPELAEAMGINANYLYRVMPSLEAEGAVAKRDKGWHPA